MASLKIGVTLWSFGPHRTLDAFARKLEQAARVGADAVQIWNVDYASDCPCCLDPDRCSPSQRREVARLLASSGLAVSGFCAQLMGPHGPEDFGGFGSEEGLEERIGKTQRAIELAVDLGSPIVTTHVGEIPEVPGHPDYQVFIRSIGQVVRHAEKIGGVFAMETGQESPECLLRFIEDLSSPAAQCNYDPANMLNYGTVEGVRILAPYIVHAHAKDLNPVTGRATLGGGDVPWPDYLQAIADIGYDGWHMVEDETGGEVDISLRTGIEFLRSF